MDRRAADELDVVMPLLDRPLGRLAHQRERLGEQAVERVALPRLEPERVAPRPNCSSLSRSSAGSRALTASASTANRLNRPRWVGAASRCIRFNHIGPSRFAMTQFSPLH